MKPPRFTLDTWFRITRAKHGTEVWLRDGRIAEYHGWRLASFGPALRLRIRGEAMMSDGWAPEAVAAVGPFVS